ncbi:MAG: 3'-5' exonuclease [Promethearchaeota archaeon]
MIKNQILVIDIETTAFTPQKGEIVEIGITLLDVINKNIEIIFDEIVHHSKINEDAWIFQNTDLTPEMVYSAKRSISDIITELQPLFDKYQVTAYNQQFDFSFLRYAGATFPHIGLDPMKVATSILRLPGRYRSYKWPKVQECLDFWSMNDIEPHRAGEDFFLEAKVCLKLFELGKFKIS